jgi:hypothetical protein
MVRTTAEPDAVRLYGEAMAAIDGEASVVPERLEAAAEVLDAALLGLGAGAASWESGPGAGVLEGRVYVRGDRSRPVAIALASVSRFVTLMGPPLAMSLRDWLLAAAQRERDYQAEAREQNAVDFLAPDPGDEAFCALVIAHAVLSAVAGGASADAAWSRVSPVAEELPEHRAGGERA